MQTNNTFIGLYVAVYDALLDDDEDVREKAAMITSCITDKEVFDPVFTLSPPAAVSRLLQFLTPKLKNSRVLFVEAVYRLTGMRSLFKLGPAKVALIFEGHILDGSLISESPPTARKPSLHLFSFVGILQQAKNQDDVLFAEEKQNLFIDPVREAERWAEVLFRSPLSQWTANLVRELGDWTLEGLKELIEATRAKEDGPLGWTSKPDVFALGMRLILAAKIHIHWSKTNNNTVVPEIKTLLKELLDQGKIHNIHGLWLDSMEEILEIKY